MAWQWAAASGVTVTCDLIYSSKHSSFALPEIKASTLANAATIKLPKCILYHVAMELLLTVRWMDVAEAHRWGLVNEVLSAGKIEDCAGGRPAVRLWSLQP